MAEAALKNLDDKLKCSICLGTYTDPKQLQCQHIFCQQCLKGIQNQFTLTCPTCHQETPVPAKGVSGLQTAMPTDNIIKIRNTVKPVHTFKEGRPVEVSSSLPASRLSNGRDLELWCITCEELISVTSAISGGKHNNHQYMEISKAFDTMKDNIMASLAPMKEQIDTIKEAVTGVDTRYKEISTQRATVKANIHTTVEELHQFLNDRKTELITQLDRTTNTELKELIEHRELLQNLQAQLSSCLEYTKVSLQEGNHAEVLKTRAIIEQQVRDLPKTFQAATTAPSSEANMEFSISADVTEKCQTYGVFTATKPPEVDLNLPEPSECQAIGIGLDRAVVQQSSEVSIKPANSKGYPCDTLIQSLECELVSEITGTKVQGSIKSRYEISYEPIIQGWHQLHIKVDSQHIKDSPFRVNVQPAKRLTPDDSIRAINGVTTPWGIALNQKGQLIVAEEEEHRVSVFSPGGEKLYSFGSCGSDQGQFIQPRGVAIDRDGNILVVDSQNRRLQMFTAQGAFVKSIGGKCQCQECQAKREERQAKREECQAKREECQAKREERQAKREECQAKMEEFQLSFRRDISLCSRNSRVYLGDEKNCIRVLTSDLTCCQSFGGLGTEEGKLREIWGIACDSKGNIYVADAFNNRIQVFDAGGKFLKVIGRRGSGRGELNCPAGVAVDDSSGWVYVCDYGNKRVCVFTTGGEFVTSFKGGEKCGEFESIHGLAVDSSTGVVYVCDHKANRIHIVI